MSTTQMAAQLYQLQQLDLDLDRLRTEYQTVTNALRGSPELRRLRNECNTAHQQWQSALQEQKAAEWALDDITQRLKTQEQRLYNGSSVSAKELQSLQQETQHTRAQQSRQEEVVLELIDVSDSLREDAARKQEKLQAAESAWEQEAAALLARRDQLEARQQELEQKRDRLTVSLQNDLLTRYTALRRTKQGRAISKVEQNACQWCRVILTPSELQHVRVSPELQTCMNCGRILYYER
jgi:predicted  nucleic acid-binding Zn-ribbon protein